MFATYYYTNPPSPVGKLQQLIIRFSTFFFIYSLITDVFAFTWSNGN